MNYILFPDYRIEFPNEPNQWNRRVSQYSSPPGTRIKEIMVILSCQGYSGPVSFADIEIVPKPDHEKWTSPENLVATCLEQIDTNQLYSDSNGIEISIEEVLLTSESNSSVNRKSITLVSHVLFDELSILDWTLRTWKEPVSLVILVPVTRDRLRNKLDSWKK